MPRTIEEQIQVWLMWILKALVAGVVVWALVFGEWETFFTAVLALSLMFVPNIITLRTPITVPIEFAFVMVLFTFLSVFLGEIADAYERFFWWDAFLHTWAGVVFGLVGFLILYILDSQKKIKTSLFIIAMFVFSFSMAVGAIWEIFEFGMDEIFGLNLQKSGLDDTMWDLIVNFFGALFISWAGYGYMKYPKRSRFVSRFIISFLKANPRIEDRFKH